jgi:hypothetical protein
MSAPSPVWSIPACFYRNRDGKYRDALTTADHLGDGTQIGQSEISNLKFQI